MATQRKALNIACCWKTTRKWNKSLRPKKVILITNLPALLNQHSLSEKKNSNKSFPFVFTLDNRVDSFDLKYASFRFFFLVQFKTFWKECPIFSWPLLFKQPPIWLKRWQCSSKEIFVYYVKINLLLRQAKEQGTVFKGKLLMLHPSGLELPAEEIQRRKWPPVGICMLSSILTTRPPNLPSWWFSKIYHIVGTLECFLCWKTEKSFYWGRAPVVTYMLEFQFANLEVMGFESHWFFSDFLSIIKTVACSWTVSLKEPFLLTRDRKMDT